MFYFFDENDNDIKNNDTNTTENEIATTIETITKQSEQTKERAVETMAEQTDTEQTTNTEIITEPSEKPVITSIADLKSIAENSVLGVLDGYIWEYCEDKNNHSEELKAFLNGNAMNELATFQSKITEYRKRVKKVSSNIDKSLRINPKQKTDLEEKEIPPFIRTYVDFRTGEVKERVSPTALTQYIQQTDDYVLVHGDNKSVFYAYDGKKGIYTTYNENQKDGFIKKHIELYNPHLVKMKDIAETKKLILSDLELKVKDFDVFNSNENIIVGVDGVLDISSGKHFAHSPTFFSTIQIPCNVLVKPKDKGKAPTFEKFINDLSNGNDEVKILLLEILAVIISNIDCSKFKKAIFLVGAGDSGKSQILNLAEMFVGKQNTYIADLCTLISNDFAKNGLMNKRLTGFADIDFKRASRNDSQIDTFKSIVGNDTIYSDVKFGDTINFKFKGLAIYAANAMPIINSERKQEIFDRMIIIPCSNIIPKEKQDPKLCEKMFAERNEIIKILYPYFKKMLNTKFFDEPQICIDAKKEYIKTSNPCFEFFDECCEKRLGKIQNDDMCTTGRMYDVFREWYKENYDKYDIPSSRIFKQEIYSYLNVEKCEIRTRDGNRYYPLTLTLESKKEFKIQYGNDGSSFNGFNVDYETE